MEEITDDIADGLSDKQISSNKESSYYKKALKVKGKVKHSIMTGSSSPSSRLNRKMYASILNNKRESSYALES